LAMRDNSAGERTPGIVPSPLGTVIESRVRSLVLMVLTYVHVFQQGKRIVGQYGGRAV
jgi:hypothetical protein